jgi:hypothetical protein
MKSGVLPCEVGKGVDLCVICGKRFDRCIIAIAGMSDGHTMNNEARAEQARWKEVNDVIQAELAALWPQAKYRQLESLMHAATLFVWPASEKEDGDVRDLWMRLYVIERC